MTKLLLSLMLMVTVTIVSAETLQDGYVNSGGLLWMPVSFLKNWSGADKFCLSFRKDKLDGWRLPTKKELASLYASNDMNDKSWILTNTWSSSSNGLIPSHHWVYSLDEGKDYPVIEYYLNYVTCVHAE